jgi:hypothetical protein
MRGGGAGSVSALEESRAGAGAAKEEPVRDTTEEGLVEGRCGAAGGGEPGTAETGAGMPSGVLGSRIGAGAGNVAEPEGAGSVFEALGEGGGSDGGGSDAGGGDDGTGVASSSR